jgi:hypothetical protein
MTNKDHPAGMFAFLRTACLFYWLKASGSIDHFELKNFLKWHLAGIY